MKSFAATQPLSGLAVTGSATLTRDMEAATAYGAMFDIAGGLLLPANMTLRIGPEPKNHTSADVIRYSGALGDTAWSVDAKHPGRWSINAGPGVIGVRYTPPGISLIIK